MKAVWTKGLKTKEEKEKRKLQLAQAKDLFDILLVELDKKEIDARAARKPDYIDAGWPFVAADSNGYIRAVQEIKNLIK